MNAADLSNAFDVRYGIPQPRWQPVLDSLGEDPREWGPFLADWTDRVAAALGPNGRVYETERAIVVADVAGDHAERSVRVVRSAVDLIEHLCLPSDHSDRAWPRLFLVIEDQERYYDFAAGAMEASDELYASLGGDVISPGNTDPETETAHEEIASAGISFRLGYAHILAGYRRDDYFAHVIAHEFTHAANLSRQLPPWLDEGVAEVMAARFMYGKRYEDLFAVDRLVWQDTVDCWSRNGLEAFWTGHAFANLELSDAAYTLAPRLAINLIHRCGEDGFRAFLDSGPWDDHGESAVRKAMGLSLDEFAASMLRT